MDWSADDDEMEVVWMEEETQEHVFLTGLMERLDLR